MCDDIEATVADLATKGVTFNGPPPGDLGDGVEGHVFIVERE
jgi:hypothetical protein